MSKSKKLNNVFKVLLSVLIIVIVFLICFFILKHTGLIDKINSIEKIRKIVEDGGIFSSLIFIFLQILQTTILQIPSIIITATGAVIFGCGKAFILSYIAIMLGSLLMFWIGRKAGRGFLNLLIGQAKAEKFFNLISNGKYMFFLMMIFPLFPDDILCLVAGVANMSFPFFFWTNIISRAIGVAVTVYFGTGAIIPFYGWGLIVWLILAIVAAILFYLSIKYKDKLDAVLKRLFKKKRAES